MWFNNALIYQYEFDGQMDLQKLLQEEKLKPCPPHARFTFGWLSNASESMAQEVAGAALFYLGKEERVLPRAVIEKMLTERILSLEESQGRKVGRTEKAQMREDMEFELLPKSFCIQKRISALLDTQSKQLIISSSSPTQANQLTALLRKSIPNLSVTPLLPEENLAKRFAEWISNPASLPHNFQLATDCLLFSPDNEKKRFNCKGYELPADEILGLIEQGLIAAELSLIWKERIQFTLTQDLSFKRLKCLEYFIEDRQEISQMEEELQADAELSLLSGELRSLVQDLLAGLEQKSKAHEALPLEAKAEVETAS